MTPNTGAAALPIIVWVFCNSCRSWTNNRCPISDHVTVGERATFGSTDSRQPLASVLVLVVQCERIYIIQDYDFSD